MNKLFISLNSQNTWQKFQDLRIIKLVFLKKKKKKKKAYCGIQLM